MPDISELELQRTPEEMPPDERPTRHTVLWAAAAVLVVAAAVATFIVWRGVPTSAPAAAVPSVSPAAPPARPLGGEAASIVLPPLDDTDPLVRELVKAISAHPTVAAWLTTDGLIRNFTVAVTDVAEGHTPARVLRALRPSTRFAVVERGEDLFIDPASYGRYDAIAAAATSLDAAGAARLYATLKPRIEEAYRELGYPEPSFDRMLERAIADLLRTPIVDDPIRVEPRGIGYAFADPKLEALTPAQKHLLRTGPRNVRAIQAALVQIARALGIRT
jgi:hypothetical protein